MSDPGAPPPWDDSTRSALAERVLRGIEALDARPDPRARDALVLDVLRHQARVVAPYARLVAARRVDPERAHTPDDLPAMPTDAFRFTRVAAHDETLDVRAFATSGTTSGARGIHALRDLRIYDDAARRAAARALFLDAPPTLRLVMLAASEREAPDSSLSYMLARFGEWFGDGEPTWVVREGRLDLARLVDRLRRAESEGVPVALLGTSFAFVHAEDGLGDERFSLAAGSRAMVTGGFKGRSRELAPEALRAQIAARYGLPPRAIVGEYGMTELSSQAYETSLVDPAGPRRLRAPPWVRVVPVDPEHLRPVAHGAVGVLRVDDPANLDSVASIQTSDLGRALEDGFEVLGRAADAVPRGCALALDEALGGAAGARP